jgi:hypothetical protein
MRQATALLLAWLLLALPAAAGGAPPTERLDRFRELARDRLGALELLGQGSAETLADLYALLDEEILESLRSGAPFASEAFLQEQLLAFSEVWGGALFRVWNLPGGLTVGAFQLTIQGAGSSVRVYGRREGGAALLRVIARPGLPRLWPLPPTRGGASQFLVAWLGPPSARGTVGLRLEHWRQEGGGVGLVWAPDAPEQEEGIRGFAVGPEVLRLRYEARYPGWRPGCPGQTEHEDRYRYDAGREAFVLERREVINGWHRELHAAVAAVLAAPGRADIPLPDGLALDLACDEAEAPGEATVTAVEAPGPDRAGGRPWALAFRRTPAGWRLTGAAPVPPDGAGRSPRATMTR